MRQLELLSPARNLECGISAIDHGADAVYIGASRFGARAAAGNSIEDIEKLCAYAHRFDAKVYVTVNTIIYNDELSDTISMVRELQAIGVDAILFQDMGLLSSIQAEIPDVTLHASTQTDNRTVEKVKWLASLGIKRVVLARELSIQEIEQIHAAVPEVELEVFVHGALCVSYSGQCYASQYCFKRSANRGECAQFCRMPFTLKDADDNILEQNIHLLSLKDMAQLDNLERLADTGAVSFKIEGRLKDVDYVKNITAAYSEKLNEICRNNPGKYERASMGRCKYTFTPNIKKSFNRGFTTYFADFTPSAAGRPANNTSLVSFDTPKSIGEPVGRVKEIRGNSFNVSTMASFSNGDGLCFFNSRRQLIGFRVNKAEGNRLYPLSMPKELKPGTMLYRNLDHAFQTLLSKPSSERKIMVDMELQITSDSLILTMTDEHNNVHTASIDYEYQEAQKPQEENIQRQLTKLGNTIYECHSLKVSTTLQQPFIQSSLLAKLRQGITVENAIAPSLPLSTTVTEKSKAANAKPAGYTLPYMYNASNQKAKSFYQSIGIDDASAFENAASQPSSAILMQCRYCLRAELGYCMKSGRKAPWKEPLRIALDDGREFTLRFNCAKCEMDVMA